MKAHGIRISMQFFAEDPSAGDGSGSSEPSTITLEQVFSTFKPEDILGSDSMKSALEAHTRTAAEKAVSDAKEAWKKEKLEAIGESKKLEKMSEAEREKYKLEKEKAEFEKQRAAFEQTQLELSVGSELQKRGLPAEFAKYLTADTAQTSKARIDEFEKAFNASLSAAVDQKLRGGDPPKAAEPSKSGITKEAFAKMGYSERLSLKKTDPEKYNELKGSSVICSSCLRCSGRYQI
ncbi:hypothetical protein Osc1_06020 [Hominimerdicola sp. 21CYCFAH17_S]